MRLWLSAIIAPSLCASAVLGAQQVFIGTEAGTTVAELHPSSASDGLRAATAGITASAQLNSWVGFQTAFSVVRKGERNGADATKLDYLEVPLVTRVGSNLGTSSLRPFLAAGVAGAEEIQCVTENQVVTDVFLAAQIVRPAGSTGVARSHCERVGISQRRHSDLGSVIGAGFSFETGLLQFSAELTRTRGRNISTSACCEMRNDVSSLVVGASRRLR